MVAISMYRGKLHRPSDAPRQWLMPAPTISLKDFRILLQRRSRALARLQSTTCNPNPNPNSDHSAREQPQSDGSLEDIVKYENEDDNAKKGSTGDDGSLVIPSGELVEVKVEVKMEVEVADAKAVVMENDSNAAVDDLRLEDKTQATSEHQLVTPKDDTLSDKEKRKKEVEEKLQILNERKHKLVQVLKQILHAEELRRRSNMQGITGRPSVSLQVDVTNDSGSMSKHNTL